MDELDFASLREKMVDSQIAGRGVRSHRVLDALRTVPREAFLPESLREFAYEDAPLPIAEDQTISQPYIVALMIEALGLEGGEKVLEIGTGSGYAAAILSRIAKSVYTVERIGQLAEKSAAVPGGPEIPESLKAQLKIGGRLVIPVGSDRRSQELVRVVPAGRQRRTLLPDHVLRFPRLVEFARQHMFDTLKSLLAFHGPSAKAIVWAHNSHVGDSQATEMSLRGEYNIGRLCRQEFGDAAYLIGFGTNSGTVAAASNWDEPMQIMTVRPALAESYEGLCHETGTPQFLLPLRNPAAVAVNEQLTKPRLERAIGVIYRPETELQSHYFQATLPQQFDEYIWFDQTRAVAPLKTEEIEGLPNTYPFGL